MENVNNTVVEQEEPPIRSERAGERSERGEAQEQGTRQAVSQTGARQSVPAGNFALATLVPPVMVAWADGEMDANEREEILRIAGRRGILEGTEAHRRLLRWLENEPEQEVYEAATRTIDAALRTRPRYEAATLAHDLHERTTNVALVSRSYWGLGPRVSPGEQRVVEKLEQRIRPFTYPIQSL